MPLPWKILFLCALLGVVWLGIRDVSRVGGEYVSYSVLSNELAQVRAVLSPLCDGSERLKSDFVNFTNSVHGLGVKHNGKVRNNIAPNVGVLAGNNLKSMQEEKEETAVPKDRYIRGDYEFHQVGGLRYVVFDGCDFRLGAPCEFGRVVVIDRHFSICVDNDGITTYLLPIDEKNAKMPRAPVPSRVSLQAASGQAARGGSWYYTHSGTE